MESNSGRAIIAMVACVGGPSRDRVGTRCRVIGTHVAGVPVGVGVGVPPPPIVPLSR